MSLSTPSRGRSTADSYSWCHTGWERSRRTRLARTSPAPAAAAAAAAAAAVVGLDTDLDLEHDPGWPRARSRSALTTPSARYMASSGTNVSLK